MEFFRRMSGRTAISLAAAAFCLGIIVVGYFTGAYLAGPAQSIAAFKKAVENQDIDLLLEMMRPGVAALKLEEANVRKFAAFFSSDKATLQKLVQSLEAQANSGQILDDASVQIKTEGKRWLLYDRFVFEVSPYEVQVRTNMKGARIMLDGVEIGTASSDDFSRVYGPFLPGLHAFSAVYDGEFATLNSRSEVVLLEKSRAEADLTINAAYVHLDTSDLDAAVIVNGIDTGKTAGDFAAGFGPVALYSSVKIKLQQQYPWGIHTSPEITLTEDHADGVELQINPLGEPVRGLLTATINEYMTGWVAAYSNLDSSRLVNLTAERKSLLISDIEAMRQNGLRFTGKLKKSAYNLNSIQLQGGSTGHHYIAGIEAEFLLTGSGWYYEGDHVELADKLTKIYFELVYDPNLNRWLITYFSTIDEMDRTNVAEYTF